GRWLRGRWGLAADLEGVASVLVVRGEKVTHPLQSVGVDLSLRMAIAIQLWQWKRLAPFLAVQTLVTPKAHDLVVEPTGAAGQTPILWIGCALGVAARLK